MKPLTLTWHSVDPTKNRARWYSVTTALDLWGNPTIIKRWGRINSSCTERISWYADENTLLNVIEQTRKLRKRNQYTLIKDTSTSGRATLVL